MTSPQTPQDSRFVRLARVCNRHRWRTFLAWVFALIAIQVISSSVGVKEISSFRLPGTESQRAYDLLAKHFPAAKGDTDQIVYRATSGTLTDAAHKQAIEASLKKVKANDDVASVASPFGEGGQLTEDGKIGVASLTYKESTNDIDLDPLKDIQKDAFTARSGTLQVEHGGPGGEAVRFGEEQSSTEGIGIVLAALVLLITFGSLVAAGLPLIATLLALGSALGVITLISHLVDTPDFAAQLASLIGLGVGIDYSLFVVTRFRSEVRAGMDRDLAIEKAIDTAGRTVLFAAITVVIALLGLLLLGLSFMHGVALGAATAVLAVMFSALTIIPALIGGSGLFFDGVLREYDRRGGFRFYGVQKRFGIPGRGFRAKREAKRQHRREEGHGWERWARLVQARPWIAVIVSLAVLLGLAIPALNLRLGSSDAGVDPDGTTTRKAYDLIAEGFGAGTNGSFLLVTELKDKGDKAAAQAVADAVKADKDFTTVSQPAISPDGQVATVTAFPKTGPQEAATTDTLKRLRDDVVPAVEQKTGARVEVGGFTASNEDFSRVVADKLPLFVGVVVLLSALLLLVVFRSVVIPVKAAIMNLLSIGAALGFITLIFQDGHGASLLGIGTGPIESFVPVLMFAIVFGLSMDYEVFLMSRVHEEWVHTNDAHNAVARGLQTTGKVITAAASIMVLVFASFALGDDRIIKLFGLGLASAVFFDAVIIRCLLVPAIMEILGRSAWYIPKWLDRRLPNLAIEPPEERPAAPRPDPVPDPV
ncbi:Membrane protein YdfJ [Baekduia alba]|uniref:MMPL family transporter n=1 Tax=Baekduia alba TaxID=2997333 RepID=UPI00233FA005|nr:MMPL family transporter [Baekduia alba]WCB92529.1 Membrane protein YdfJ [Baekduia alba]